MPSLLYPKNTMHPPPQKTQKLYLPAKDFDLQTKIGRESEGVFA
jgi:hypothetical protein